MTSDNAIENKFVSIDLLRHGETVAGKCFLGSTDAELNDKGWLQMQSANLEHSYDVVLSSPLKRCAEYAQTYAQEHGLSLVIKDEFREMSFGQWETRTSDLLWETDRDRLSAFWNDPLNHSPPDGEDLSCFKQRVLDGFYPVLDECEGKRVLLVCHAGVIKVILCAVLKMDLSDMHRMSIDHGSVSRVSVWQQLPQVNFINR